MKAKSIHTDKMILAEHAASLVAEKCDLPFAFVIVDSTIVYAQSELLAPRGLTPVGTLLSIIFEEHQDLAFFILRNKIYCSYEPTAYCYGVAKVTGKGVTLVKPNVSSLQENFNFVQVDYRFLEQIRVRQLHAQIREVQGQPLEVSKLKQFMENANEQIEGEAKLHDRDRPIWAIVLDGNLQFVTGARNSNKLNKTQHAEVNCIRTLLARDKLPTGPLTLVVSHKPCKMCAGLLWEVCRTWVNFKVYYLQNETGGLSSQTVLDVGSPDRLRFATPFEREIALQYFLEG